MKNGKLSGLMSTPLAIIIVVGAVVLVVEYLFMALLHEHLISLLPFKLSDNAWDVIDATTLTAVLSPVLYFLVFRNIQEREERFRQTLAIAPNAIVLVDGEGRITDWNSAAQKMFGYSKEEAMGQQMHQLLPPHRYRDDAQRGFARFEQTGEGPVVGKVTEISALRKDGSEFPIELSISAVRLQGHWHAIGIIHDITERKRAEELVSAQHAEIARARLDWEAVFDSISHPIFLHDGEFRVIRANRAYAAQAGKPFKEIIGQPYYASFPKSDKPLPSCLRAMEEEEEEEEKEEVAVGAVIYRSRSFAVRNEQGVYLYSVHIFEDITEQRRTDAQLRLFRNLIDQSSDSIFIVEPATSRFLDVNEAAGHNLGYGRDELLQRVVLDIQTNIRDAAAWQAHIEVLRTQGSALLEFGAMRKDGSQFPVEASLRYITVANQDYIIAVIRDITERRRAEEVQRENMERYRQLFGSMSSGVTVYTVQNGGEDFIVKEMNRAGERICQTSREQAVGKSVLKLFPGVKEMGLFEVLQQVWRSGEPQHHPASLYRDSRFSMWAENYVYKLPSGEIVAVFDDATERKRAEELQRQSQKQLSAALEDMVGAIAATLEQRDPYTAGHQRRVAELATAIGEEMGVAREALEGIHFGGMIHDIGKISVPAEILGKPGHLTVIEFGLIKTHAEAGYQIVKEIAFPWPVADMVRQHHERLDGSGYPQGLKGEQIALEARILAVADVVEAMSANRPYRPGFGMDAALDEITRARGIQLDAVAVDACLRIIREKGFVFTK